MAQISTNINVVIKVDRIPDEIPGTVGPDGDFDEPISGAEQVAYDVFKRIQEILPEHVYAYIEAITVLEPSKLIS